MSEPENLLLVDLSHIFRTFWHVSEHEDLSKAFQLTIDMVRTLASGAESGADYTAICIDSPPYWRKEVYPGYKAQRAETPPQVHGLFDKVKDRLRADGYLLWAVEGNEADDVIATACKLAEADPGIGKVVIASSDKDLHQLVGGKVTCYSPMNRVTFDAAAVVEKHGVEPRHMVDYLSLVGDASDNVPGVPGVGPKTAAALMNTFGSLEAVLAEAKLETLLEGGSKITKPALKKALVEHAGDARLAKKLIALRTDLPLDWSTLRMERKVQPLGEPVGDIDEPDESLGDAPIQTRTDSTPPPARVAQAHALAPITNEWSLGLEPNTLSAAHKFAMLLSESRLYTRFQNAEAIWAVMIRGREMGLGALVALDNFHIIEGKPAPHAHLIIAKAMAHPDCEYFQLVSTDDTHAEYLTKRRGWPEPTRLRYTIEQAKQAGVCPEVIRTQRPVTGKDDRGQWEKRTAELLRKTCGVQLSRIVYPESTQGMISIEELES